jgi:hypothetical protein
VGALRASSENYEGRDPGVWLQGMAHHLPLWSMARPQGRCTIDRPVYCSASENGRHSALFAVRHSVFERLAGYEDVNDAER